MIDYIYILINYKCITVIYKYKENPILAQNQSVEKKLTYTTQPNLKNYFPFPFFTPFLLLFQIF